MNLTEYSERPFLGDYKLTRNSLHPRWESLVTLLPGGEGICLDIGCGDGHHQEDIKNKGYQWVGCDIEAQKLSDYVLADALSLPFKTGSIDVVFSNSALEHMKDPFAAASEIARVLKPKGRAYLLVALMEPFHGSYFHITHWGLEELANRSKLKIIQMEPGATTFVPIWSQLFDVVGLSTYRYLVPPIVFFIQRVLRPLGYVGIRLFYGKSSWQYEKLEGYYDRLPLKLAGHIKCIMEKS